MPIDREHHVFQDSDIECSTTLLHEFMTHCVAIKNPTNKLVTPTLAKLCIELEKKKYYKFWLAETEQFLNNLNIEFQNNDCLRRYTWYDEDIIPANEKSKTVVFNLNRQIDNTNDRLVRVYMLRQESRIQIFRQMNYDDYTGTVVESLIR